MNVLSVPRTQVRYAASLEDAYQKGYFTGSMSRWELLDRIQKFNPDMATKANARYRGIFINERYVCGLTHNLTIPKWTIVKHDPKQDRTIKWCDEHGETFTGETVNLDEDEGVILARGWPITLDMLKRKGFQVDEKNLF